MAAKPTAQADWDTTLANLLAPPGGQISAGWGNGQVVPSNWLNWWMNLVGTWTDYLFDGLFVGTSPGGPGLQGVGGAPSNTITGGDGLQGIGTAGTAGTANGGNGVTGQGATSAGGAPGQGVKGTAANQATSYGVTAIGNGAGGGLHGIGTATRGAATLDPQATPTTPANGDVWVDSTTGGAAIQATGGRITLRPSDATPIAVTGGIGFANGWGDGASPVRYWKDANGMVHVDGQITKALVDNTVMFTLPAGYRPTHAQTFSVPATVDQSSATTKYVVSVQTNGNVSVTIIGAAVATDTSVWLTSIHFSVN